MVADRDRVAADLLCGWLSWRYIEVPTLSLRRYLPPGATRHGAGTAATPVSISRLRRPEKLPERGPRTEREAVPAASA